MAIDRLKHFEPPEGYYVAFSGGKDSIVIERLAKMAGVKHDTHYSVTTIDPPELVYFIREHYPDVIWERPEQPLLVKLATKGFPLRHSRWCCELYKENGGNGRCVVMGIRSAESYNRSRLKLFEHCMSGGYKSKNKSFLNPIIDWTDEEVWQFIHEQEMPYCKLYDEGHRRIGCMFCPMSKVSERLKYVERYPGVVKAFIKAFSKLHSLGRDSTKRWYDGEEMFWWWLREDKEVDDKQKMLFE